MMRLIGFLLVIFSIIKFVTMLVVIKKDYRDCLLIAENKKDTILQNVAGVVTIDGILELLGGLMLMSPVW